MAKAPLRSLALVLVDARRALRMTQKEFGSAVGASHRSAVRWDAGHATPAAHHLRALARLVYPVDRALAEEVARHGGETLEELGLEQPVAPPPPPQPLPPAARVEDLVDLLVLTAHEGTGLPAAALRPALHAVFRRGCELRITMQAAEEALRAGAEHPTGGSAPGSAEALR
jgi:transcriptional regulator with XRE-family HTH domain